MKEHALLALLALGCNPRGRESPATQGSSSATPALHASGAALAPDVLFDYGASQPAPPTSAAAKPSAALMTKIGAAVAGLAKTEEQACVRRAARIVSSVAGAFTAPGRRERLYLVEASECGPRVAASEHEWAIVVGDDEQPIALAADASAIDAVMDLDGDGVSSVLVSGGFTGQGITAVRARVVDLRGGALHVRQELDEVLHDACGSGAPGATRESKRIVAERQAGRGRVVALANAVTACSSDLGAPR